MRLSFRSRKNRARGNIFVALIESEPVVGVGGFVLKVWNRIKIPSIGSPILQIFSSTRCLVVSNISIFAGDHIWVVLGPPIIPLFTQVTQHVLPVVYECALWIIFSSATQVRSLHLFTNRYLGCCHCTPPTEGNSEKID